MAPESTVPTSNETRARGSKLASLAALLSTLMLTASACGSSGTKTEVLRLRSANPVTSDLYVRMKGPAGAVSFISKRLITGGFSKDAEGVFLPPRLRQKKTCSLRHTIGYADAPDLQAWNGRKMTITVYGNSSYAATYCRGIRFVIYAPRS
jgi:hypothetical protein